MEKMAVEGAFMQGLNPAAAGLPYPPGAADHPLARVRHLWPRGWRRRRAKPGGVRPHLDAQLPGRRGRRRAHHLRVDGAPHLTVAPGTQGPQTAAPVPVAAVKSSTSSSLEAPASPLRSEPTEEPTRITPDGSVHSTVQTEKGENAAEGVTAADIDAVTEAELRRAGRRSSLTRTSSARCPTAYESIDRDDARQLGPHARRPTSRRRR